MLGRTDILPAGAELGKAELLFEKIEDSVIEAQVNKLLETKKANELKNHKATPIRENIAFDDFMKLDIRVGKVLECQKVPKADKLLQFRIDDGLGGRTIVSGIAKHYAPEDLVGKNVCFVANLEPRKLKGTNYKSRNGGAWNAAEADAGCGWFNCSLERKGHHV